MPKICTIAKNIVFQLLECHKDAQFLAIFETSSFTVANNSINKNIIEVVLV